MDYLNVNTCVNYGWEKASIFEPSFFCCTFESPFQASVPLPL